eukprot:792625_1
MMLLFTISILVFPPASTASSVFNTTAFVATGMTEHPVNSSSAYYTTEDPSAEPTLEPTWMPTMDGEFPYIHHTQSYIACGKNIELHDSMYTNVYAGFATNQTISISLQFIVCKASSTFHYWDELHLWHGDANNYTEWNVTTFAPTLSSIDCTTFKPAIDILFKNTYFVGLVPYKGDDYGTYTLYMQCETYYNQYIHPIAHRLSPQHAQYSEYPLPYFDSTNVIGHISCGITLLSQQISKEDWFEAPNRQQMYSFTVTKYIEWIELSTCDSTNKPHTLTLYYTNGGQEWATISRQVSATSECRHLSRDYLIPGTYYLSVDITHLLYNDYTIAMRCSVNDSVVLVTDYNKYNPPFQHPTAQPTPPTAAPTMDSAHDTQSQSTDISAYLFIAFVIIAFIVGAFIGYKKYKTRRKNTKVRKRKKQNDSNANQLEMVVERKQSNDTDSSVSLSSSHESDEETSESKSSLVKQPNIAMAAVQGGIVREGGVGHVGEGDVEGESKPQKKKKKKKHNEGNDDVAPPVAAFGNINYDAIPVIIPPIMEGAAAVIDYDEKEEILPDEQHELQVGSYCYVDCDTVYGVITEELTHDYYRIIDLFEKRSRRANKKTLTLIQDNKGLSKAKKQHERFKRRQRRKSSNKKLSESLLP